MPHNRFFSQNALDVGQKVYLDEDESHHAIKVMRLSIGDKIEIVDGKGHLAIARAVLIEKKTVVCEILSIETETEPPFKYIIAQGLLRHTSMELVCEKITELGAQALWIFSADLSEKETLSEHQIQRLYRHRLSALKQCGRLLLPEISFFSSLEELVRASPYPLFFGDIESGAPSLKEAIKEKKAVFVVGPESGFSKKEEDLLKNHGAQGVSLHPLILRAETASLAASAQLSLLLNNQN